MIAQIEDNAPRASTVTLGEIEKLTARLADTSTELDDQLAAYEAEMQAVNDKHLRPLKRLATATAQAKAELHAAIESAPHLFVKPRTITMHGLKIGYSVSQGKIEFDSEETVVALLKKHHKEEAGVLIKTTEKPSKDAIRALELDDIGLRRIACRLVGKGDAVLIKREAGEIEKLIEKLTEKLVEAIVEAE